MTPYELGRQVAEAVYGSANEYGYDPEVDGILWCLRHNVAGFRLGFKDVCDEYATKWKSCLPADATPSEGATGKEES